ncbi:MAG TPA: hypothetical protein VG075_15405 [Candidatus Acidoferrum sp.]|jgi:hypothetical protein|nr:hypothetical protein [Candidatus Acidoferrum sp.]
MKLSKLSLTLLGSALLFSSAVLAGDANKGSLQLYEKVNVEGKALNPGKYTITWDGTGPNVQVTVLQGKQAVATFPAHLTEQATRNSEDAYGSAAETDGSRTLTAIYPNGKRFSLELETKSASQAISTPASK